VSRRDAGLELIAAHLSAFDPDAERARERLEREIGAGLATLLVDALSRRSTRVAAERLLAAAAA